MPLEIRKFIRMLISRQISLPSGWRGMSAWPPHPGTPSGPAIGLEQILAELSTVAPGTSQAVKEWTNPLSNSDLNLSQERRSIYFRGGEMQRQRIAMLELLSHLANSPIDPAIQASLYLYRAVTNERELPQTAKKAIDLFVSMRDRGMKVEQHRLVFNMGEFLSFTEHNLIDPAGRKAAAASLGNINLAQFIWALLPGEDLRGFDISQASSFPDQHEWLIGNNNRFLVMAVQEYELPVYQSFFYNSPVIGGRTTIPVTVAYIKAVNINPSHPAFGAELETFSKPDPAK